MEQNQTNTKSSSWFKTWSILMGIAMIILGLVTISISAVATFFTMIILGIVLLIRGCVDVLLSVILIFHKEKGFWWHLFGGILSIVVGALIIIHPAVSAAVFTFLVAVLLISSGLYRAVAAPVEHSSQWGWVMLGGIVSFLIGIWILAAFPTITIFFVGLLVGIEILVHGMVMVSLPYALQHSNKPVGEHFAH